MKYIVYFLIAIFLTGCTAQKHEVQQTSMTKNYKQLDSRKSAYISVPEDGRYGSTVYHGSGEMTTQAINVALSKYVDSVITSHNGAENYNTALKNARNKNASYLFYPHILGWEDRATEWSGKPDKISIKIRVVDVKRNQKISSIVINGKSPWMTLGGDRPQDLLEKPINEYINSLYN